MQFGILVLLELIVKNNINNHDIISSLHTSRNLSISPPTKHLEMLAAEQKNNIFELHHGELLDEFHFHFHFV